MHIRSIDDSNISEFYPIADNMKVFIKVYNPHCGHCKAMETDWNELSSHAKELDHNAGIIELHSDVLQDTQFKNKYSSLANKVQGYPSLMILEVGGIPSIEYKGDRSYKDMLKFCNQHLISKEIKKSKSNKYYKKNSKNNHKGGKSTKKKLRRKKSTKKISTRKK